MNTEQRNSEVKKMIDSLQGLPNMHPRKGTAHHGNPMTGIVDYNWQLFRDSETREYTFYCEWVDLDGSGNRIYLPNAVVNAILRAVDSLNKKSRSEGAKKATETRKARGIIPFQKKSEIEQMESTEGKQ